MGETVERKESSLTLVGSAVRKESRERFITVFHKDSYLITIRTTQETVTAVANNALGREERGQH